MTTDPTGGWAKAVEKGSEAATEVVRAGRDAGGFIAPALRHLVGMAEDQFALWRAERQIRLAERFVAFLHERGLEAPSREIAPAFLLPLIEKASLEGDDDLQDVWAMMLANAADAESGSEMRSAFISMLAQMARLDVNNLAKLDAEQGNPAFPHGQPTGMLPEKVAEGGQNQTFVGPVAVSLHNLARLGCIEPQPAFGGMSYFHVTVTPLGKALIVACTPRSSSVE